MSAILELGLAHITPTNVSMGVAIMLMSAGLVHALPGPMRKLQAEQMGMPAWFLFCAGLLMFSSGALHLLRPDVGLYGVALSMGGAVATAAKMPKVLHRPGGLLFSNATLGAALWAVWKPTGEVDLLTIALCVVCYLLGIVGRILAPTSPLVVKLLGWLVNAEKEADAKKTEAAKPKEGAEAGAEGTQPGKTSTESTVQAQPEQSGARKRVSSPVPASQTARTGA